MDESQMPRSFYKLPKLLSSGIKSENVHHHHQYIFSEEL